VHRFILLYNAIKQVVVDPKLLLDLVQKNFLLNNVEDAQHCLKTYLDTTMKRGPSCCQACHQRLEKDAIMSKCSGERLHDTAVEPTKNTHGREVGFATRPCAHCESLEKTEKKKDDAESCNTLCNDFFESIAASGPANPCSGVAIVDEQYESETEK